MHDIMSAFINALELSVRGKAEVAKVAAGNNAINFFMHPTGKAEFDCVFSCQVTFGAIELAAFPIAEDRSFAKGDYRDGRAIRQVIKTIADKTKEGIANYGKPVAVEPPKAEKEETGFSLDGILSIAPEGNC